MLNFQEMIAELIKFWSEQGCIVHQGYDLEVGAGTFNPATFLRCLGPEPYSAVYVEPSRRPKDGRYGENPNRVQFYHQMQVIIKPSPANIQELYLESLKRIGFNLDEHDIRFVHDDWENPTIGAWGLGWEIWLDGMEVTQFTYFQAVGGLPVKPVSGEITYGLERLAMYLQGVDSMFDIKYSDNITYGDIFKRNEYEWSHHNFHEANDKMWLRHFDDFEAEANRLIERGFPIPAYDYVMKASHAFNILDARGVISVTERTGYISRIRALAKNVAEANIKSREQQQFPLLRLQKAPLSEKKIPTVSTDYNPNDKEDFVLEIGSEELPATFVPIGLHNLEKAIKKILAEQNLEFDAVKTYGTPRRLTAYISGLKAGTKSQTLEKKGPPLQAAFDSKGDPTEIGAGFCRSIGLEAAPLKQLKGVEVRKIKEVEYLFAKIDKPGVSTKTVLAATLPSMILDLDFPKKMHWGSFEIEYARPLRWIVSLYGKEVIPFALADIISDRISYGHRQLDPSAFSIDSAQEYLETLKKHSVMADVQERKNSIVEQLRAIEQKLNVKVVEEEKVLAQVLHLVELPFVTTGHFAAKYLKAPKEILASEMIEHQKYFPLAKDETTLAPFFAIVCNNKPTDKIVKGNEKALTPRLADGLFLFEEDLKVPLETFNEKLKNITFQKELGSIAEKVRRIRANAAILDKYLALGDFKKADRAALFCKADLASQVVGEFPELQGTCGKLFALHHKEDPEVALAIEEHWMPKGEKAPLPKTASGTLVSLAEKFDNLISCFSLGLLPTSSSDPYALRRQALGIVRMILEQKKALPIRIAVSECLDQFLKNPSLKIKVNKEEVISQIEEFLKARAKSVFLEQYEKDEIEAALSAGMSDIYDRGLLLENLKAFRKNEHDKFLSLLTVVKRARKIIPSEGQGQLKSDLLNAPAEKTLFEKLQLIKKSPEKSYDKAFLQLCSLEEPLAKLFESVKIMDDDQAVRKNRLALLQEVCFLCDQVLDFSKIQEHELETVKRG